MKAKVEEAVCQECGQVLKSWDQHHTWFDCEKRKKRVQRLRSRTP